MFTVDLYFYFKITFCSYILWSLKRLFKQHSCKYKFEFATVNNYCHLFSVLSTFSNDIVFHQL